MTHLLQPCDNRVFARFKQVLQNSFARPTQFSTSSYRKALADALPEALTAATTPSVKRSSFSNSGVYPVCAAPVLSRICGPLSSSQKFSSKYISNDMKKDLFGDFSPKEKRQLKEKSEEKKTIEKEPKEKKEEKIEISKEKENKQSILKKLVDVKKKKIRLRRERIDDDYLYGKEISYIYDRKETKSIENTTQLRSCKRRKIDDELYSENHN
ncbi:uncharacterized protein MONOS_6058 [Monocercomonoides exilis]|uniref:uncharacterized protein n=1 Tax=Monocercomonoides exilis TaxID=2049356 RepID=UPI00355A69C0|nr:hypothetical protein MONOS_6058 [Monocercomonoides exilis]|eukprot:MONOS_6058.1-p1 / transcript=MONOS_6058.1 / gene=MONOS_6058 / organism=Monocercomonoides_exilis_PA203 / gene_product=unspecified product / transcript_product=unspecified product / location=Mono_scaffold00185:100192-100827(+) / protein_length=212 / sequence_SO=supercontig / SO=protein_coding / is_pseudo=false